jgi:heme-degrading monooxygenase HmoA
MHARVVTATVDPSRTSQFHSTVTSQVEPIIRSQPGFIELISLTSDNDPSRVLAITLWRSQSDLENYAENTSQKVVDLLSPFFTSQPKIETFSVDTDTAKKLTASAA